MSVPLESLDACFNGIVPGTIATCSAEGEPNVSYVSTVRRVDARHVALSCQFFNKTRRNLEANPYACIQLYDPVTFEAWRLLVRYDHSETSGPVFDALSRRVDAIASHTGMTGVFKLLSADVCEVLSAERIEGFLAPDAEIEAEPEDRADSFHELAGLQLVSACINRACDLEALLADSLEALERAFGFTHTMIFVPGDLPGRLVALASRGYGDEGVGAEIAVGEGLLGTVAAQRAPVRSAGLDAELRYGRAVRERVRTVTGRAGRPEIPLPGLPDARSQLALPLLVQDRVVGVLAAESRAPLAFASWHEDFLQIVANQIALGYERLAHRVEDVAEEPEPRGPRPAPPRAERRHRFCFYRNDDCVFVDGEYLIRNVPGRILWKVLTSWSRDHRTEYANRELRLDPTIGLPPIKDNLESRLILLRKRLAQKCPDVRLVPTRRGRFALELDCDIELEEKDNA